jgi:hypothetical protein
VNTSNENNDLYVSYLAGSSGGADFEPAEVVAVAVAVAVAGQDGAVVMWCVDQEVRKKRQDTRPA